jgi:hypothetical protein
MAAAPSPASCRLWDVPFGRESRQPDPLERLGGMRYPQDNRTSLTGMPARTEA